MLNFENISAKLIAYDRPSPKLIGFLKKHFELGSYTSQNNNFLLFNEYFDHINTNKNLNFKNKSLINYDVTSSNLEPYRGNLANVGHNLMYKSNYSNPNKTKEESSVVLNNEYSNQNQYTNRGGLYNSNTGFSNYFLNSNNKNYIFSKKKLQLLSDYPSKEKFNVDEYVK